MERLPQLRLQKPSSRSRSSPPRSQPGSRRRGSNPAGRWARSGSPPRPAATRIGASP